MSDKKIAEAAREFVAAKVAWMGGGAGVGDNEPRLRVGRARRALHEACGEPLPPVRKNPDCEFGDECQGIYCEKCDGPQ